MPIRVPPSGQVNAAAPLDSYKRGKIPISDPHHAAALSMWRRPPPQRRA